GRRHAPPQPRDRAAGREASWSVSRIAERGADAAGVCRCSQPPGETGRMHADHRAVAERRQRGDWFDRDDGSQRAGDGVSLTGSAAMELLAAASGEAHLRLTRDGRIDGANAAAELLLASPASALRGQLLSLSFAVDDRGRLRELVREA